MPKDERLTKQLGLALEALEAIADCEGTAQVIAQQTLDDIVRVGMEAVALSESDRIASDQGGDLRVEVSRLVGCAVQGDNAEAVTNEIMEAVAAHRIASEQRDETFTPENIAVRDRFIVYKGLWDEFVSWLRAFASEQRAPAQVEGLVEAATALSHYAWSGVTTDCKESGEYLQTLLDKLRAALAKPPIGGEG